MPKEETKQAAEQSIEEAVQTIIVDNREIPIAQAPEVLKSMETSLRQDYVNKMNEAKQEREKTARDLKKDIEWLNTYDNRLYPLYSPLVEGGTGFIGTEAQLHQFDDEEENDHVSKSERPKPLQTNPELKMLRDRLAELENKQRKNEESTFMSEKDRVLTQKKTLQSKYPNAYDRAVIKELGLFFTENQRHPTNAEIESIVKAHHDEVTKIKSRGTKVKEETGIPEGTLKTATPAGTTESPGGQGTTKAINFEKEPDKLVNSILRRLSGGA